MREDKDKPLFKEGLWTLYGREDKASNLMHLCRGYNGEQKNNHCTINRCLECGEEAPLKIGGLNKMHNWEAIQRAPWQNVLGEALAKNVLNQMQKDSPLVSALRTPRGSNTFSNWRKKP